MNTSKLSHLEQIENGDIERMQDLIFVMFKMIHGGTRDSITVELNWLYPNRKKPFTTEQVGKRFDDLKKLGKIVLTDVTAKIPENKYTHGKTQQVWITPDGDINKVMKRLNEHYK